MTNVTELDLEGAAPAARGRAWLVLAVALVLVALHGWRILRGYETRTADGPGRAEPAPPIEPFAGNLRHAVVAMQNRSYGEAGPYLAAAGALRPDAHVAQLIRLNAALADGPAKHLDEMVELSGELSQLRGDEWVESGVVGLGRELFDEWKQVHQARFEQRVRDELEMERRKLEAERTKRAEALRGEAQRLIKAGYCEEEAIAKIKEALIIAPATMQTQLINLQQVAQNSAKHAEALRKGREEIAAQNYDAAKTFLESIPDSSIYFKEAAVELAKLAKMGGVVSPDLEKITYWITKREAQRLYGLGDGPKALALLKGQTAEDLLALREKIECVVDVYTQAQELYEKKAYTKANELWDVLIRLVGDPSNQYTRWAEANKRVDPSSERVLSGAARMWEEGRFVEAAKANTDALVRNPKNPDALKLRATIERQVNLKFSIARQKWETSTGANKNEAFLAVALENYVLLRAGSPHHRLLGAMAELIVKAGGTVPAGDGTGSGS